MNSYRAPQHPSLGPYDGHPLLSPSPLYIAHLTRTVHIHGIHYEDDGHPLEKMFKENRFGKWENTVKIEGDEEVGHVATSA